MRLRWMGLALAFALAVPLAASAQVRTAALARIKLLNKKAMDEYDGLEFEAAKTILADALEVAREAGISTGAALVSTHLNLGIVYGAGLNDRQNAIKSFGEALRLDPRASLDPTRSTPVLEEMFKAARESQPPPPPPGPAFLHQPVDQGTVGRPLQLRARVSSQLGARSLVLYVRSGSSTEFEAIDMAEERPGQYSALIPADRMVGRVIHYYVEAQDEAGQRLAGHGNAGSPNLIVLRGREERAEPPPPPRSSPRRHVTIGVMIGTGLGVVHGGESEHTHPYFYKDPAPVEVGPGFALAPFHLAAELSYHLSDRWELAASGRIQLVNATSERGDVSFLGLARVKYHLGNGPLRWLLSAGGGGGQVRHRIPLGDYDRTEQVDTEGVPLSDQTPNDLIDTRVAGLGAITLGLGLRYMFSAHVGLIAELNLIFLVPQFAANADINTGLLFSF